MDITVARELVQNLRRNGYRAHLKAEVVPSTTDFALSADQRVAVVGADGRARWAFVPGGRVVFSGGLKGDHSIDLLASSPERVLAHWEGYCEANGLLKPKVGQRVEFPSGSSRSGYRFGRVLKVGSKRAVVSFTYKHGGESTKSVAFEDLRF